jgi:hypothetical protein
VSEREGERERGREGEGEREGEREGGGKVLCVLFVLYVVVWPWPAVVR